MPCSYCLENRKLINAHIIPRPFHPVGGDLGDAYVVSGPDSELYPKRSPIGVYDPNILCKECDAHLGRLDQHAVEKLLRGECESIRDRGVAVGKRYVAADPDLILSFIISVAWRATLSGHSMFQDVATGPYEGLMLEALKAGNTSKFDALIAEFDEQTVGFLNPHHSRFDGVRFLIMYAERFVFYLKLDKRPLPSYFEHLSLRSGQGVLTTVRKYAGSKELDVLRMVFEQPRFEPMREKWRRSWSLHNKAV